MAYPNLPASVIKVLGMPEMRRRHNYWHAIKSERFINDANQSEFVSALANVGWEAPQIRGIAGHGLDFLFMHRNMIQNVNNILSGENNAYWPNVTGWLEIPKDADSSDWPEPIIDILNTPAQWPEEVKTALSNITWARSSETINQKLELAALFKNPASVKNANIDLDTYGTLIEDNIHDWMHIRFSALPPMTNEEYNDPANDYLGDPYSSHVNKYFWKLHGWIDDCITVWEDAYQMKADFSRAWRPPQTAPSREELLGVEKTQDMVGRLNDLDAMQFFTRGEDAESAMKIFQGPEKSNI